MKASFKSRADPSQGGGAAGVHRQTLDGEHGSGTRPERVRGMQEEEKKRVEGIQKQKDKYVTGWQGLQVREIEDSPEGFAGIVDKDG